MFLQTLIRLDYILLDSFTHKSKVKKKKIGRDGIKLYISIM